MATLLDKMTIVDQFAHTSEYPTNVIQITKLSNNSTDYFEDVGGKIHDAGDSSKKLRWVLEN